MSREEGGYLHLGKRGKAYWRRAFGLSLNMDKISMVEIGEKGILG